MISPLSHNRYTQHSEKNELCQTFLSVCTSLPQCGQYVFPPVKNIIPKYRRQNGQRCVYRAMIAPAMTHPSAAYTSARHHSSSCCRTIPIRAEPGSTKYCPKIASASYRSLPNVWEQHSTSRSRTAPKPCKKRVKCSRISPARAFYEAKAPRTPFRIENATPTSHPSTKPSA